MNQKNAKMDILIVQHCIIFNDYFETPYAKSFPAFAALSDSSVADSRSKRHLFIDRLDVTACSAESGKVPIHGEVMKKQ